MRRLAAAAGCRSRQQVGNQARRPRGMNSGGLLCALLITLVLTQGGCTSISRSTSDLFKLTVSQHRSQMPTAAQVAANRYYQMYVHTSTGQAVLILGNLDGNREDWYGHGNVVIFLRHGQIVKTSGLAQNLEGLHEPADNPFARGLQHLTAPIAYTRTEDWSGYRYGVPVHARLEPLGKTRIDILGTSHEVLHVRETLDAPAAHYHAVNQYWVDPTDGLAWKSIQQIVPGQAITLVQLKPFRGALP